MTINGERKEIGITLGHESTFESDEYVPHVDCGDCVTGAYIWQNV